MCIFIYTLCFIISKFDLFNIHYQNKKLNGKYYQKILIGLAQNIEELNYNLPGCFFKFVQFGQGYIELKGTKAEGWQKYSSGYPCIPIKFCV